MPRNRTSPWKYDRATIRFVLETEGLDAARARWPRSVVDPIARVLHLTKPYNAPHMTLTLEQVAKLGTRPDAQLAAEWNLPGCTVSTARRLLGIPTLDRRVACAARQAVVQSISDAELCGPTRELVSRYNLALCTIAAERRRRGVRATSRRGRHVRKSLNEHRSVAIAALRSAFPVITLDEIGAVLGITRERVRQIELVEASGQ